MTRIAVGDQVRVERDETKHPSKGSWPRYRGRVGAVVELNGHRIAGPIEYGVTFTKAVRNEAWFQRHELTRLDAGRARETGE